MAGSSIVLERTAIEEPQTGDAAPVDTGIEANYNGDEGGDSYGQTGQLQGLAGDDLRGEGEGLHAGTGGAGADTSVSGRIAEWAKDAQIERPEGAAGEAVKTVEGYGVRAVVVQDTAIKARDPKALALTEGGSCTCPTP